MPAAFIVHLNYNTFRPVFQAERHLATQAAQTTDEKMKAFINTIQTAPFGGDLSQLGHDLSGIYRQAWEAIRVGVETGSVAPQPNDQ